MRKIALTTFQALLKQKCIYILENAYPFRSSSPVFRGLSYVNQLGIFLSILLILTWSTTPFCCMPHLSSQYKCKVEQS